VRIVTVVAGLPEIAIDNLVGFCVFDSFSATALIMPRAIWLASVLFDL
jgi:hypothetical protein